MLAEAKDEDSIVALSRWWALQLVCCRHWLTTFSKPLQVQADLETAQCRPENVQLLTEPHIMTNMTAAGAFKLLPC